MYRKIAAIVQNAPDWIFLHRIRHQSTRSILNNVPTDCIHCSRPSPSSSPIITIQSITKPSLERSQRIPIVKPKVSIATITNDMLEPSIPLSFLTRRQLHAQTEEHAHGCRFRSYFCYALLLTPSVFWVSVCCSLLILRKMGDGMLFWWIKRHIPSSTIRWLLKTTICQYVLQANRGGSCLMSKLNEQC